MEEAALDLNNVTRIFKSPGFKHHVVAIRDVSLEVRKHEFVAIVGLSGCGKSTLLRVIAGLLPPTSGTVMVDGRLMTRPRVEHCMVFQNPTLLPWATVLQNVLLPLRLQGRKHDQSRERAMALLGMVGLAHVSERVPDQLSGGMQQRVALCRALITSPSLLLMDEPFAALDALTRELLGFELLSIWERQPKTVLFVTHSIQEAVLLADRVLVMAPCPGPIQEIVTVHLPRPRPREVLDHPGFRAAVGRLRRLLFDPGTTDAARDREPHRA